MANKKQTQAQKATRSYTGNKKNKEKPYEGTQESFQSFLNTFSRLPMRAIGAVTYLVLFLFYLVIAMGQEGIALGWIESFALGMCGKTAFYVAIPGFLYLFIIQAFSGDHKALGRSCCGLGFIFLTGCIAHLILSPQELGEGTAFVGNLYATGVAGTSGGVLCGSMAELLKVAFGEILSYILLIFCDLVCLLAVFRITIPSIIRAVESRPRTDKGNPGVEYQEPASVIVHTISNTLEKRRQTKQEKEILRQADEAVLEADFWSSLKKGLSRTKDKMVSLWNGEDMQEDEEFPWMQEPAKEEISQLQEPMVIEPPKASKPKKSAPKAKTPQPEAPAEPTPEPAPEAEVLPPKVTAKEAQQAAKQVAQEIATQEAAETKPYKFPPLELLRKPRGSSADGTAEMRDNTRRLNETLASFKIDAHISNVTRGPSVTRYELELEKGVRLNRLTSAADDIALSLGASGVRIAPVPGKISVVGIEVPNLAVTTVSLREVVGSNEFAKAESKSTFAVGKDIGGNCIVGNIAQLPHMLIAGTTGSGKSVCMNSIIISLLYKAKPEDVKLIMIDPKMVELGIYNGIPHLLIPVVTDPKKAAGSLQWAVVEMLRRYKSMSDAGVRDLESYNSMIGSELEGEKLPEIVVIIDELADLMLVAAKEVEESICRIAQMGRAAGIHLIIATQRPSADVITGLMKANIPSRIAFAVASAMESRIILDTQGAEKLVGKGDMLYSPTGSGKPQRVQGCFVSDSEVEAVASHVKAHFTSIYDKTVMEEIDQKAAQTGTKQPAPTAFDPEPSEDEQALDEEFPNAVEVVLECGQASVSMLQRRLKLGYGRAARIMDEMEEMGVVGPFMGAKPRQVLITKEDWVQMQQGQTILPITPKPQDDEEFPEEIADILE